MKKVHIKRNFTLSVAFFNFTDLKVVHIKAGISL